MKTEMMMAAACAISLSIVGIFVVRVDPALAVSPGRVQRIGGMMSPLRRIEALPGFRNSHLSSGVRNLLTLANRWSQIAPMLRLSGISEAISVADLSASRYSGFTQSETSTAWCGRHVVVGFNDTGAEVRTIASGRGVSMDGYAVSGDRGDSFTYMGSPATASDPYTVMSGDPVVTCSGPGEFYYLSNWFDGTHEMSGISLSRSTDGGNTFGVPIAIVSKSSDTHILDKPWMAIDPSATNRIYVVYTDLDFSGSVCGIDSTSGAPVPRYAIEEIDSMDGGTTWSAAPTVVAQVCADQSHSFAFVSGSQVAVGPAGQVYVVWESFGDSGDLQSRTIEIATSMDAGVSFSAPTLVTPVHCAGDCADWQGLFHSNEYPSFAVGKGPHTSGKLYIAWNDGDDHIPDALTTIGFYNFTDIFVTKSKDGGATWSTPVRVNDNVEGGSAPLTDQFEPAIAADDADHVAVCFYDRRNDPRNVLIDRYCASSYRGGPWTNTRITGRRFPVTVGQDVLVAPDYMGDYDTLTSDFLDHHSGFIGAFADNRSGVPVVKTNTY